MHPVVMPFTTLFTNRLTEEAFYAAASFEANFAKFGFIELHVKVKC